MLSEEEKAHIIEKVRFENEIRKALSPQAEPKRFSWLNSKIFLLLLGSLITGLLVPWFQITQKTIEWRRQNQFDNINFRLGMMRDCLREFVYLSAYTAEAYERVKPFMGTIPLTQNDYEGFQKQYMDLMNSRFRQNAKVRSLIIHFRDANALKELFRDYVNYSNDYLRNLERFAQIQYCISKPGNCKGIDLSEENREKLRGKIEDYPTQMNVFYQRVISKMKQDIGRAEDENEKWL